MTAAHGHVSFKFVSYIIILTKPSLCVGTRIGKGAHGSVYHAHWHGRKVAIKKFTMSQAEASRESAIPEEVRLLKSLRDRHIIQFYGTTEHEGQLVLVMEYADGGSLTEAIKQYKLDWPNKARIAQEMARGLAFIHRRSVLHRDLKSMNVLLTRHMEVKLCDFGMATVNEHSISKSASPVKGTHRWMAPELFVAKPIYSTKSDMFAFGTVMWEMVANCTRPFRDHLDCLMAVNLVRSGVREELPDDTPEDYRRWVERCWDQDPDKRPEANEMVTADEGTAIDSEVERSENFLTLSMGVSSMSLHPFTNDSINGTSGVNGQFSDDVEAVLERVNADNALTQLQLAMSRSSSSSYRAEQWWRYGLVYWIIRYFFLLFFYGVFMATTLREIRNSMLLASPKEHEELYFSDAWLRLIIVDVILGCALLMFELFRYRRVGPARYLSIFFNYIDLASILLTITCLCQTLSLQFVVDRRGITPQQISFTTSATTVAYLHLIVELRVFRPVGVILNIILQIMTKIPAFFVVFPIMAIAIAHVMVYLLERDQTRCKDDTCTERYVAIWVDNVSELFDSYIPTVFFFVFFYTVSLATIIGK
ncbi:hypothetical protein BGZ73_005672 [Actinomortierella ambigua]|nr:hypothetical protein BGZ73_005672 [Actinomortierella ambigua]